MQMAELLVSHGASLSARTSMDEMPIGKSNTALGTHISTHQLFGGYRDKLMNIQDRWWIGVWMGGWMNE